MADQIPTEATTSASVPDVTETVMADSDNIEHPTSTRVPGMYPNRAGLRILTLGQQIRTQIRHQWNLT